MLHVKWPRVFGVWTALGVALNCAGLSAGGAPSVSMTTVSYYTGAGAEPAKQSLDLYRPAGTEAPVPVLLFFHGGVWQQGDKSEYRNIGEAFARRGILTAVVNYRLSPSVHHPAHIQDAARATAWMARHAAEYGGRPDRLFLSGHSAGGQLVTLLLFDPRYLRNEGLDAGRLAGVIAFSGVFDLTQPIDDTSEGGFANFVYPVFGKDPAILESASPMHYVHHVKVPLLIVLAGDDYHDMRSQSRRFVEKVARLGSAVTFEIVPGRGHFELVEAIGSPDDPTTDLVARFITGRSSPGSPGK